MLKKLTAHLKSLVDEYVKTETTRVRRDEILTEIRDMRSVFPELSVVSEKF